MNHRLPIVLAAALALGACYPGLRPYDGVVGYELKRTDAAVEVTYTEDAVYGMDFLEQQATKVCASTLQAAPERLEKTVVSKQQLQKDVSVSIQTAGPTYSGGGTLQNMAGDSIHNLHPAGASGTEGVKTGATFYQLVLRCSVAATAPAP